MEGGHAVRRWRTHRTSKVASDSSHSRRLSVGRLTSGLWSQRTWMASGMFRLVFGLGGRLDTRHLTSRERGGGRRLRPTTSASLRDDSLRRVVGGLLRWAPCPVRLRSSGVSVRRLASRVLRGSSALRRFSRLAMVRGAGGGTWTALRRWPVTVRMVAGPDLRGGHQGPRDRRHRGFRLGGVLSAFGWWHRRVVIRHQRAVETRRVVWTHRRARFAGKRVSASNASPGQGLVSWARLGIQLGERPNIESQGGFRSAANRVR